MDVIIKHDLCHKHIKLNEKEKKDVLKKYNADLKDIPKIFINDAAIIHLNPKTSDLIKIVRTSKTNGKTEFYRGVIDG